MRSWVLLLLPVLAAALPQSSVSTHDTTPGKPAFRIRRNAPLQSRQNRLIPVVVGGVQDTFVPNAVSAAVGDVIQFQFSSGNHTVTESTADAACTPLQLSDPAAIHSGHIPFQEGQTTVGTFNMPVTSTDTKFFYCATGPHCQNGQIMVLNPTSDQQIINYSKLSTVAPQNVDGTTVVGGIVGQINLDAAAFVVPANSGAPAGPPPA